MFPDSEWANPTSSYNRPVPVPPVDPDDNPNWTVCFRAEWLPYVIGALSQLLLQSTWDTNDENIKGLAQYRSALLISQFVQGCPPNLPDGQDCAVYPLSSSLVSYYPCSPYTAPVCVPDGWTGAPFTVLDSLDGFLGYHIGDVVVTGFPSPDSGDLTLPSIRIDVVGTGVVEIHLLTTINGGMALVTVDDDLLNSVTFDLNADEVSIPPESVAVEIIHEVKFESAGAHHVEVRFVPVLDDTLIPIRFGGAIRSVELCGFPEMTIDVRQNPDNPCELQKTVDGTTWVAFARIDNCIQQSQGKMWRVVDGQTQYSNDGTTFYDFPDGSEGDFGAKNPYPDGIPAGVDAACIAAINIVTLLRNEVEQWIQGFEVGAITLGLIAGGLAIVMTAGLATPAVVALMGTLTGAGALGIKTLFTESVYATLECLIYETIGSDAMYSGSEFANLQTLVIGQGDGAWGIIYALFNVLGPVGLTNAVHAMHIENCPANPCDDHDMYREFDFTIDPYPAHVSLAGPSAADNTTATGLRYSRGTIASKHIFGSGYVAQAAFNNFWGYATLCDIKVDLQAAIVIKKIEFDVYIVKASGTSNPRQAGLHMLAPDGSDATLFTWSLDSYPDGPHTFSFSYASPQTIPAHSTIDFFGVPDGGNNGVVRPKEGEFIVKKMRLFAS